MTMPTGDRTTREKASDAPYEEMRRLIVEGRLAPGSRLIETDLVKRLEVSRSTIRSALQKLDIEGLVNRVEGGRVRWFVSPLTRKDIRELSEIMSALEGVAAGSAAKLDGEGRKKLAQDLREINEELRSLAGADIANGTLTAELDAAFHRRLIAASGRPRLIAICDSVKPQIERYGHTYMVHLVQTRSDSADEHAAVIMAIENGNAEAAEIAIQSNRLHSAERYVAVMEEAGERGTW